MATFHLQIVTPDRMVFDGQAERVIVRTLRGDVCILARHIDYAAPLGIGEARVTDADGVTRVAACSGGMIGVDFTGKRYDMGSKLGVMQAQVETALRHPEIGEDFRAYLKEIAKEL